MSSLFELEKLGSPTLEMLVVFNDNVSTFRAQVVIVSVNDTNWEVNVWVS